MRNPVSNANLVGIGLMLLGIFLFVVNDVIGKWLMASYSVAEVLLIRSIAAMAMLLPMLVPLIKSQGRIPFVQINQPLWQLARIVCSTLEVALFYWSVSELPLANVISFYLAGPIFVTALSGPFLGETVTRAQWLAVLLGFAGVLVALNPSAETMNKGALIAILGSFAFAIMILLSRRLRGTPDLVLVTGQTLGALIFGLILSPLSWIEPGWIDGSLLALLGIVAALAHLCVNRSLKLAPAAVVTPYQYSQIVWGVLFGYLIFGDVPDWRLVCGSALIISAGFYLFLQERQKTPPVEAT
jgi:drug/metabolite transporter (DMT)-like permease